MDRGSEARGAGAATDVAASPFERQRRFDLYFLTYLNFLLPILAGVLCFIALRDWLFRPESARGHLALTGIGAATMLLGLRALLAFWTPPHNLAHPLGLLVTVMLTGVLGIDMYVLGDAEMSSYTAVLLFAMGGVFLDVRWFVAGLAIVTAGWCATLGIAMGQPREMLFQAIVLWGLFGSLAFFFTRLQLHNRAEALRELREREKAHLARALQELEQTMFERNRAEEALRNAEARNRAVLSAIPDFMLVLDRNSYCLDFHASCDFEFVVPIEEMVGTTLVPLVPPKLRERLLTCIEQCLETRATVGLEFDLGSESARRFFEMRVAPLGPDRVLAMVRDISGRRKDEAAKRALEARVREMERMESLALMAGGIAQDLGNLLTGILGSAGIALAEIPPNHPVRAHLDELSLFARRASSLVEQMLAFAGETRQRVQALDFGRVVRDCAASVSRTLPAGQQVEIHNGQEMPGVFGDEHYLRQAVANLIMNASEAIGERAGRIRLELGACELSGESLERMRTGTHAQPGTFVFVRVSDSGPGMAAGVRERVFDPSYTTKFTGRGLGLAAALGIVRAHSGAIDIESQPGAGTTFSIYLPGMAAGAAACTGLEAASEAKTV